MLGFVVSDSALVVLVAVLGVRDTQLFPASIDRVAAVSSVVVVLRV